MKRFSIRVFWFLLVVVIVSSSWLNSWPSPVSASGPDPRLIQLEFEVSALQSQVAQMQSQLGRNPNASANNRSIERLDIPATLPGDLSMNAQFDNLATLVIEINQRVISIENQLSDSSSP